MQNNIVVTDIVLRVHANNASYNYMQQTKQLGL